METVCARDPDGSYSSGRSPSVSKDMEAYARQKDVAPTSPPTPSRPVVTSPLCCLSTLYVHKLCVTRWHPTRIAHSHPEHSQGGLCGGDCGVCHTSVEPAQGQQSLHLVPFCLLRIPEFDCGRDGAQGFDWPLLFLSDAPDADQTTHVFF